jgi:hypothetical protein
MLFFKYSHLQELYLKSVIPDVMKNLSHLLALLLTSITTFVSAQTFQTIPISSGLGGTYGRVIAADMDNDGDPDGVVSLNGALSILKYNAGAFARTDNNSLSFGQNIWSLDAGDINRDGYIDIVNAGRAADNTTDPMRVLLLNNGTQLVPSGNQNLGWAANSGTLYLGDLEGDGDLDLLSMVGIFLCNQHSRSWFFKTW